MHSRRSVQAIRVPTLAAALVSRSASSKDSPPAFTRASTARRPSSLSPPRRSLGRSGLSAAAVRPGVSAGNAAAAVDARGPCEVTSCPKGFFPSDESLDVLAWAFVLFGFRTMGDFSFLGCLGFLDALCGGAGGAVAAAVAVAPASMGGTKPCSGSANS